MSGTVRIGIIGDFNPALPSHRATNDALNHAGESLALNLEISWLPTQSLAGYERQNTLRRFDGLWAAPGSPYQNLAGAVAAIRFAREQDRPFIGT